MTTVVRMYPTRVALRFAGKQGQAALDQIRAIDRNRLVMKLESLSSATLDRIAGVLIEMFSRS